MVLLWYLFKIRICETNNILHKSLKNSYGVSYSWLLILHGNRIPSSKGALRVVLSCVVLLRLEGKVPMFCVCAPISHSPPPPLLPPVSLLSFILPHKAVLRFTCFFHSFISSHWLYCYLYNYFAATFSDFLFCFSFEIYLTNIQIFFSTLNTWTDIVRIVTVQTLKLF